MITAISRAATVTVAVASLLIAGNAGAQETSAGTRLRFGMTVMTISARDSGRVHIECWRGHDRVAGVVDATLLEEWAGKSAMLLDQTLAKDLPTAEIKSGDDVRVEHRTPFLGMGGSTVIALDRIDRGGRATFGFYAADASAELQLYIALTQDELQSVLTALQEAASTARRLASAAAGA